MDRKLSMKAARVNAGLTQAQMAENIGVSEATVRAWETNERYPDVVQFVRFCKICGVSLTDIFLPEV